jgi:DNA-binding transcriptional LysR family regulator
MHFTLRQLVIFQAVADNLSFTRAAEALHLSQPAVSMQIRQLESHVELPLFEQLGRKVFLTEAGRELYGYSRRITDQLRELEEVLNALKGVTAGSLRVSVATTANEFSARMLAGFGQQNPGSAISLDVTNRATLIHQLNANECDLVIMGRPPDGLDVIAQPFLENPLVVVASPTHPLAGSTKIPLTQLASESFVLREPGSGTRGAMERVFEAHGITLNRRMELGNNEAVKQVVSAGLGLAVVSAHTVVQELETGRLVILKVEAFPILREWYLVHRRGKRLSPVAQAFCEFVLQNAETFRATSALTD